MNKTESKFDYSLSEIPMFSELNAKQLKLISSFSKLKVISKGENIFNEGDYYLGFYALLKGMIKVSKISNNGNESVVHIIKPINTFAEAPLFEGTNYPVSAKALEESLILLIPKEKFIDLIYKEPEISLRMLTGFAKKMRALVNQLEDISSKEVINRLAKYILDEINLSGTENISEPFIKLSVPKSTIASYLGTITETLSRTFKKLQDEKVIRVDGKKIFVCDIKRLKELSK